MFKLESCYKVEAFSNADWVGYIGDKRSTSGYCVYISKNMI